MIGQYKIDATKVSQDEDGSLILVPAPGAGKKIVFHEDFSYDIVDEKTGWYKIFDKTQQEIDDRKGDLECGAEADLMQMLIDNYYPPVEIPKF